MKTFSHECPQCSGEGTVDEIDHAKTHAASEEPVWKVTVCDVCNGDGELEFDERQHGYLVALCAQHEARRVTDRMTIDTQRQHIANMTALLKAARDREAQLEQHIGSAEVVA